MMQLQTIISHYFAYERDSSQQVSEPANLSLFGFQKQALHAKQSPKKDSTRKPSLQKSLEAQSPLKAALAPRQAK